MSNQPETSSTSILERPPIVFEQIRQEPWKLTPASFPVLSENGPGREQFRRLGTNLRNLRSDKPFKSILVTSSRKGEGKSFMASNLALNLALHDASRVLIIDGDHRNPTLHRLLGATQEPGLTEYLSGCADTKDILRRVAVDDQAPESAPERAFGSIAFVPAGGGLNRLPREKRSLAGLLAEVGDVFDWIILDSPPALAVSDALDFAPAVDGILLVMQSGKVPSEEACLTANAFSGRRILGCVLNQSEINNSSYYYYGSE